MQSVIGALRAVLGVDTVAWEEGFTRAEKQAASFKKRMSALGEKMSDLGQSLSIGVTAPLAAFGVTAVKAATESRAALGQVEAALTSMGGASGKTSAQLQEAAAKLQGLSTFDDDDILAKVTANMLTFGNVAGAQFDRAQLAAVNLATRLNMDLQSAALMVGKALNDPVKGITAMSRAGIQFTADQKAMIESMVEAGNAAGAQRIILGELERQFGGAAEAARKAAPDQALVDAWREFQETIGGVLLQVLPRLTELLRGVFEWFGQLSPSTQTFIVAIAGLATALGPVLFGVGQLITVLGALGPAFAALMPVLATVGSAIGAMVVATGPIGLLIAAIAAVGVGAYLMRDKIKAAFEAAVAFAQQLYQGVKTWLVDKLGRVWDSVRDKVKAVGDFFYKLWDRVVGNSYVPDMVTGIGHWMGRLDGLMVDPAAAATRSVGDSFADMALRAIDAINQIGSSDWRGTLGSILGAFGSAGGKLGRWANFGSAVLRAFPGFANGGSFEVGGRGGVDQNLVAFRATRGEQVSITRPGSGGGDIIINQTIAPNFAGNAATREDVIMMGRIAKDQAMAGALQALRNRGIGQV